MKVIVGSRNYGKTMLALKWLAENKDGMLIVCTHDHMVKLKSENRKLSGRIKDMAWLEGSGQWGQPNCKIFIDDVDMYLARKFSHSQVAGISVTVEGDDS